MCEVVHIVDSRFWQGCKCTWYIFSTPLHFYIHDYIAFKAPCEIDRLVMSDSNYE